MLNKDQEDILTTTKIERMQKEIDVLNAKILQLELALNVEVWDHKRAKFIPFKETPEVVKVLQNAEPRGQV